MVAADWLRSNKREDDLVGRSDSVDASVAFSGGATTDESSGRNVEIRRIHKEERLKLKETQELLISKNSSMADWPHLWTTGRCSIVSKSRVRRASLIRNPTNLLLLCFCSLSWLMILRLPK
ncbi:hypothetical protein SADUNF_Sadunf01G0057000 [Salix dunnii]|uniref:Uncharacterized protein n=1 Tax=Salix dunnii TaxID=1413687 RepID=A0A835NAN8_9ROSI|nr:hypothetical protein SADUNF_Sadunf01G0057000 [Salix dunnii]